MMIKLIKKSKKAELKFQITENKFYSYTCPHCHTVVELCGDIPRIELFAREKFNGWDAWGNEV
jgi:N6-adenosine-specific RNA methylase IME4